MRRIATSRFVLLAGIVLLLGCVGPHEIDDEPATAPESEERRPAEPEAAEPDDAELEQPAEVESARDAAPNAPGS